MVIPTLVVASYYGLLRSVSSKNEFIHFIISLLAVVKSFYKIQAIAHNPTRASVLFKYVTNILKGDYPQKAFNAATKNKDLDTILSFEIDNFTVDKESVQRKTKTVRPSNGNKSGNGRKKKNPHEILKCRYCGVLIKRMNLKTHLSTNCKERELPPR